MAEVLITALCFVAGIFVGMMIGDNKEKGNDDSRGDNK